MSSGQTLLAPDAFIHQNHLDGAKSRGIFHGKFKMVENRDDGKRGFQLGYLIASLCLLNPN
eukprot:1151445-Pelagomonas_calceolata.AAC.3